MQSLRNLSKDNMIRNFNLLHNNKSSRNHSANERENKDNQTWGKQISATDKDNSRLFVHKAESIMS